MANSKEKAPANVPVPQTQPKPTEARNGSDKTFTSTGKGLGGKTK